MQKYIIILFLIFAGVFGGFILYIAWQDNAALVNDVELHGLITEKYQSYKGKPHWYDIKVDDTLIFPIRKEMKASAQVGDSIFKKKGEAFVILKKAGSGDTLRFEL